MKKCFKCHGVFPLTQFYKHPMMADGHLNKCKECTRKDSAKRLEIKKQDPEWVEKERIRHINKFRKYRHGTEEEVKKINARAMVTRAIAENKIKRLPCVVCGNPKSQGHHEDYDKPLEITWLCIRHHNDRHIHLTNCANIGEEPMDIDLFVSKLKENTFR